GKLESCFRELKSWSGPEEINALAPGDLLVWSRIGSLMHAPGIVKSVERDAKGRLCRAMLVSCNADGTLKKHIQNFNSPLQGSALAGPLVQGFVSLAKLVAARRQEEIDSGRAQPRIEDLEIDNVATLMENDVAKLERVNIVNNSSTGLIANLAPYKISRKILT